ncbi:hypothetical protein [Defluviimonas salinarum]|uniref:Hemolysin-type calcium-binding repeat-containing protein n=1 Tax=Defluviimonas salinarum TaxID=2992147 RepID=A0ABT3J892_9RHOB|nr:hypothetical protein [Defluviimonas salinarum]MCW3783906.1 hypothetical protein [Defluviimonas salinarum]
MQEISAQEQLFIELTNRARLDPLGEAARFGIGLNDGLAAGTISGEALQVLAVNDILNKSALGHSTWMLDNDVFSHTGAGGTGSHQRIVNAGYALSGAWATGENLAFTGTTGSLDLETAIVAHHEGLFRSASHRVNTMNGFFREFGVAQVEGVFTQNAVDFNTSMTTVNFGRSGTSVFLTGVTYDDANGDGFYSIGEGRSGISFSVGGSSAASQAAGGYGLALAGGAAVPVRVTAGARMMDVSLDMSAGNVKLDVVGGTLLRSSASMTLGAGAVDAELLGSADLDLSGNDARNTLTGNKGANLLSGGGGSDWLYGLGGDDTIQGGGGNDLITGDAGHDRLFGDSGNDRVFGGSGDDLLMGGDGDDLLNGGAGTDSAVYYGSADLTVSLSVTGVQNTGQGLDELVSIENLGGAAGNDRLTGSEEINVIWGNAGNDIIDGLGGSDRLHGGTGHDRINGGAGNDFIFGEDGDDVIMGGIGNDFIDGGAGEDTATYSGSSGVTVSLAISGYQNTGQGNDRLTSIENLGGTSGNDVLTGNAGANKIWANSGNDTIDGGGGNDLLVGGAGADTFIFRTACDSDQVRDFALAQGDRLSLDDALWGGGKTAAEVVSTYASVTAEGVLFDFGGGDTILLSGLGMTAGLDAGIGIF